VATASRGEGIAAHGGHGRTTPIRSVAGAPGPVTASALQGGARVVGAARTVPGAGSTDTDTDTDTEGDEVEGAALGEAGQFDVVGGRVLFVAVDRGGEVEGAAGATRGDWRG